MVTMVMMRTMMMLMMRRRIMKMKIVMWNLSEMVRSSRRRPTFLPQLEIPARNIIISVDQC